MQTCRNHNLIQCEELDDVDFIKKKKTKVGEKECATFNIVVNAKISVIVYVVIINYGKLFDAN